MYNCQKNNKKKYVTCNYFSSNYSITVKVIYLGIEIAKYHYKHFIIKLHAKIYPFFPPLKLYIY